MLASWPFLSVDQLVISVAHFQNMVQSDWCGILTCLGTLGCLILNISIKTESTEPDDWCLMLCEWYEFQYQIHHLLHQLPFSGLCLASQSAIPPASSAPLNYAGTVASRFGIFMSCIVCVWGGSGLGSWWERVACRQRRKEGKAHTAWPFAWTRWDTFRLMARN